jgi:PIN domain nuclease of toxin-antitoxin system
VIVLDTHAWLWWVDNPERLSDAARRAIRSADQVGVSTFSCWEVATLVERGRLELDRELRVWVRQALAHDQAEEVTITAEIAIRAAQLDRDRFPGDPADRIIYATAEILGSPLITQDKRIAEFDSARAIWN